MSNNFSCAPTCGQPADHRKRFVKGRRSLSKWSNNFRENFHTISLLHNLPPALKATRHASDPSQKQKINLSLHWYNIPWQYLFCEYSSYHWALLCDPKNTIHSFRSSLSAQVSGRPNVCKNIRNTIRSKIIFSFPWLRQSLWIESWRLLGPRNYVSVPKRAFSYFECEWRRKSIEILVDVWWLAF